MACLQKSWLFNFQLKIQFFVIGSWPFQLKNWHPFTWCGQTQTTTGLSNGFLDFYSVSRLCHRSFWSKISVFRLVFLKTTFGALQRRQSYPLVCIVVDHIVMRVSTTIQSGFGSRSFFGGLATEKNSNYGEKPMFSESYRYYSHKLG